MRFKNKILTNDFQISLQTCQFHLRKSQSKRKLENDSLKFEFKRTNYAKFSLKYKGAIMWNSLPDDIKNIDSFNRFKKGLKLYIQNQPCIMKSRTNIV